MVSCDALLHARLSNPKGTEALARFISLLKKRMLEFFIPLDCAGLHDLVHDVMGGIVFGGSDFGYPGHFSDANVRLNLPPASAHASLCLAAYSAISTN